MYDNYPLIFLLYPLLYFTVLKIDSIFPFFFFFFPSHILASLINVEIAFTPVKLREREFN